MKQLFLILIILTSSQLTYAKSESLEVKTLDRVTSFINLVYSQEKTDSDAIIEYKKLVNYINSKKSEISLSHYYYLMSLTEFYAGKIFEQFDNPEIIKKRDYYLIRGKYKEVRTFYKDREKILFHYHNALDYINLAIKKNKSSKYLTFKSTILGGSCIVEGLRFMVMHGSSVSSIAKMALERDPNNVRAQFLLISSKVYTPTKFGGNPLEAERLLLKLEKGVNYQKHFNFDLQMALAYSYIRLEKWDLADKYIKQALRLYPHNNFALGIQRILISGHFHKE